MLSPTAPVVGVKLSTGGCGDGFPGYTNNTLPKLKPAMVATENGQCVRPSFTCACVGGHFASGLVPVVTDGTVCVVLIAPSASVATEGGKPPPFIRIDSRLASVYGVNTPASGLV